MRAIFKGFSASKNVLFVSESSSILSGESIRFLRENLFEQTDVFGLWALDVETIEYLESQLGKDQPAVVIECGSGLSTLWLAQYAARMSAEGTDALIVSLEQSADEVKMVMERLRRLGLDRYVSIIHAPLDEDSNYKFDTDQILRATGHRRADWLLIDGPYGAAGCRRSTLPSLLACCNDGVRWFLDDAFRDAELAILEQWDQTQDIVVEGILPMPKGLATGTVNLSARGA